MNESVDPKNIVDCASTALQHTTIYPDMIQPAAKQFGRSLETVGRAINAALLPLEALVWKFEQYATFMNTRVADKLKNTPEDQIITPKPNIAVPAIEALRYSGHEEEIADLFANLLAASMDRSKAGSVHPAFVELIKQLTPDEAKLLKTIGPDIPVPVIQIRLMKRGHDDQDGPTLNLMSDFSIFGEKAGCDSPNDTTVYLNNICRLGLGEYFRERSYSNTKLYEELENCQFVKDLRERYENKGAYGRMFFVRGLFQLTAMGVLFRRICVTSTSDSKSTLTESISNSTSHLSSFY